MKVYTLPEAAKLLKCSERQIFRYLASGKLDGSKHGKWRFTDQDTKKFLESGRKGKPKQTK